LLPLVIENSWIEEIRAELPELPDARRNRFISVYGLPAYDAELLTSRRDVADYFETAVKIHPSAKALSNWIIGDLLRVIKDSGLNKKLYITDWPVAPAHLAEMVRMIDQGKISGKIAKTVFEAMLERGEAPAKIVADKGLEQVSDAGSIET